MRYYDAESEYRESGEWLHTKLMHITCSDLPADWRSYLVVALMYDMGDSGHSLSSADIAELSGMSEDHVIMCRDRLRVIGVLEPVIGRGDIAERVRWNMVPLNPIAIEIAGTTPSELACIQPDWP